MFIYNNKYYAIAKNNLVYYKYNSWTQPVLTSNSSSPQMMITDPGLSGGTTNDSTHAMTWGSSSVTRFSNVYTSMDSNTTNYWALNNGNRTYTVLDFVFDMPMKITQVAVVGNVVGGAASSLTGTQVYQVDGTTATRKGQQYSANTNTINFTNITKCRVLRICMRPNNDGGSYPSRITSIKITGTRAAVSTSSSYDFTETVTNMYSICYNGKYY